MQLTLDFPSPTDSSISKLLIEEKKLRLCRRAEKTRTGYAHDWKTFEKWCSAADRCAFPATIQTLSLFLVDQLSRGYKITTAQRRLRGVLDTLYERGCPLDGKSAWAIIAGAQRLRCEQPRQMAALTVCQLSEISGRLQEEGTTLAIRDRSIITLGFASALRRSNLSALTLSDVTFCTEGILIRVRKEKQDQTGKGRTVAIPNGTGPACAVAALVAWLVIRGRTEGPLYTALDPRNLGKLTRLCAPAILKCAKRNVSKIGLDPDLYGAHSLRAGFVTEALSNGIGEIRVANHTGHRSLDCLRRYFRPRDVFASSACAGIGL